MSRHGSNLTAGRVGTAGFAVAAAAMVATPLLQRGRRRLASTAVVSGLAVTTGARRCAVGAGPVPLLLRQRLS